MFLFSGTLVNVATVLIGSAIGLALGTRLPERMREIILHGLGLASLAIGFQLALKTDRLVLIIASLLLGGLCGEALRIERALERGATWLKGRVGSRSQTFVDGFITASLVFCVGAMTIVGSLEEGIRGDASILFAKSALDGFASIAFAASLGIGVAFAAGTVLVVQGGLTLLGARVMFLMEPAVLDVLTATGGLLIVGIGLHLLGIKKIRISNLLPALVFAPILAYHF
jgi:uncharacterized membrane protein YqgA involved in biofilm formation